MIRPAFKTKDEVRVAGYGHGIVEDVNPGWDDDEPEYRVTVTDHSDQVKVIKVPQRLLALPADQLTEVAGLLRELIAEIRKDRERRA